MISKSSLKVFRFFDPTALLPLYYMGTIGGRGGGGVTGVCGGGEGSPGTPGSYFMILTIFMQHSDILIVSAIIYDFMPPPPPLPRTLLVTNLIAGISKVSCTAYKLIKFSKKLVTPTQVH